MESPSGKTQPSPHPATAIRAIVALGNPGRNYAHTRHNAGWLLADRIADGQNAQWQQKFKGELTRVTLGGAGQNEPLWLLKPMTFMNLSGHPAQAMAQFYGLKPQEIVVLHDDLDLPFGRVQIKAGGGHGGHNGLRSLVAQLGSAEFARVRIGIGRSPNAAMDVADWVLSSFSALEHAELPDVIDRASVALNAIASLGVHAAMNRCNGTAGSKKSNS